MPKEAEQINRLATELRAFDVETYKHSKRVASLIVSFGSFLGIDSQDLSDFRKIGLLHDVGKTKIPLEILTKKDKLTDSEMEIMRRHAIYSADIIDGVPEKYFNNKRFVLDAVLSHHEDWNGNGYPFGLSGDEIPEAARILRIVDSYDAIRSRRYYKEPTTYERTIQIMTDVSGKQFDPNLLTQFNDFMRKPQAA